MNDFQVPDWVLRVRELNAKIEASSGDIARWAEEKRTLVQEAGKTTSRTEIARLLGIGWSRVGQLLDR